MLQCVQRQRREVIGQRNRAAFFGAPDHLNETAAPVALRRDRVRERRDAIGDARGDIGDAEPARAIGGSAGANASARPGNDAGPGSDAGETVGLEQARVCLGTDREEEIAGQVIGSGARLAQAESFGLKTGDYRIAPVSRTRRYIALVRSMSAGIE